MIKPPCRDLRIFSFHSHYHYRYHMAPSKTVVITVPTLILSVSGAVIFIFFLMSSLSYSPPPCSCPTVQTSPQQQQKQISATAEDIQWVKSQIEVNGLHMQDNVLRKGINPRTRAQQLQDLIQYKGISHYEEEAAAKNHTSLPCPNELLVEEHHSNYGEPWAGGRDVFEFLAESSKITPESRVLEIGCGTLRVGLHFIDYLIPEHFHCLERDELSLMAAFRYELPAHGLLQKRPLIVKGEDMVFERFGSGFDYDLIYASAVFLHMPDKLVWVGLERLVGRLKPLDGRIFVSHNVKFCSRLGGDECSKRLKSLGLEYMGKHTHDSLLFNHYEIWFEFRRFKA
ncbi:putative S-adenosyl-L-methionine-dependent methyltransferase [Helianthus annuus]|nr:putative S-adenosyl-L-methionine-dependent methyltransferase [Helianthus annuus]